MAVALVAVAIPLLPASAVAAITGQPPDAIGVRLIDAPVERRDDPRANRAIVDHVEQGDVVQRRILVANTYDVAYDVPVYVTGAEVTDSTFVPMDQDGPESPLEAWSSVSPSPLPLEGQSSGEITVTIRVPTDAADGEYYGLVFAEAPVLGDDVQVVNRVGVRIYLSVGRGLEPPTDFEVDSLTARRNQKGEPEVSVRVVNTGQRALDLVGELELSDGPGGLNAGPFSAQGTTTLGIGGSGELFVPLDPSLPDGPWKARFVARSGVAERTAEATVTFPGASATTADPSAATEIDASGGDADGDGVNDELEAQRRVLLPLAALMILLAIAALWMLVLWRRRDKDDEEDDPDGSASAEAPVGVDGGG